VFKGPIPDGMLVCHNCPGGDNPACWNPEHLWAGSPKENIVDASKKGRMCHGERAIAIRRRAAPKGEACNLAKLTEENVIRIRKLRAEGWLLREIAALFPPIGIDTVSLICLRRWWKHVP